MTHPVAMGDALGRHDVWIHADIFPQPGEGIALDEVRAIAIRAPGPIDVHLLVQGAMHHLDAACALPIDRLTFPFEDVADPVAVAAKVKAAGLPAWLALAPDTSVEDCRAVLPHIDGVLVMLIKPGTRDGSSLELLDKVREISALGIPAGVDGGVNEGNLPAILEAGATYLVMGRSLVTMSETQKAQQV